MKWLLWIKYACKPLVIHPNVQLIKLLKWRRYLYFCDGNQPFSRQWFFFSCINILYFFRLGNKTKNVIREGKYFTVHCTQCTSVSLFVGRCRICNFATLKLELYFGRSKFDGIKKGHFVDFSAQYHWCNL